MNESLMKALMKLFAIAASINEEKVHQRAIDIVSTYLKSHLSQELVSKYIVLFGEYLDEHKRRVNRKTGEKQHKEASLNSVKVLYICQQINGTLAQKEKQIVFLRLIEFMNADLLITEKEFDFIQTVADTFSISATEFAYLMAFVRNKFDKLANQSKILFINSANYSGHEHSENFKDWLRDDSPRHLREFKHLKYENFDGEMLILHLESTNTFLFKYLGDDQVVLNGLALLANQAYVFHTGSIIKAAKGMPIYYADVAGMFLHETEAAHIELFANEVQFHFKNSPNGIQQFNLKIEGGQLIGIMGSSGVGKSTLFNILNGTIIPQQGSITINGFDLSKESRKLRGIIGYVPQDDLLIEELTVFQNLYYNARLCFSGLGEPQIVSRVNKMISDLDLDEISTLTVGNSLNKFISGGQRKRLNIALELIREPAILFVDEPTSGLSSMDSETVMLLLKEQTAKGKLVVVNIHQPSSDVYKLFDKLLILDKGGRMIYNGNPIDAIGYFKRKSHHVNPDENECPECGNVNPEQILQIVEARMVNEVGQFTKQRKVVPEEWYAHYREHLESSYGESVDLMELPQNYFKLPGLCSQFLVFFMRNLRAKLTNKQYIVINLLQAPLLAFILAYATKYAVGTDTDPYFYVFAENKNFPGFLFMGVIVALFFGLTVSAEEIIKDRKILQRESFLRLSRWSYINSKFSFLLLLSAFQSIVYVLISNWVLQVHDMTLAYWSILFSISVCANIIGLNISSALDSVVAIYILIPLIIIPQLLLSGAMISFENLHKRIGSSLVVPIIGDLMVSRWGYEALTVYSFKENSFEKNFFDAELDISDASFKTIYLLPQLKSMVDECQTNLVLGKELRNASILNIVWAEMANLNEQCKEIPPLDITVLKNEKFGEQVATKTIAQIGILADYFTKNKNKATRQKEEIYANLVKKIGKDGVYNLQTTHHNKALSAILENKFEIKKIVEEDGRLVQTKDHIFRRPATSYGRAHFYASYKKLGGCKIDTLVFNLGAIWLMITLFYLMLWHNTIRRIIDYITLTKLKWRQRTKSTHNVV